jgi:putative NADH-flavin reductase
MAPKTITLLGGTGPTGLIFLEKAVANGHNVVVFARTPSKIPEKYQSHEQVKVSLADTPRSHVTSPN